MGKHNSLLALFCDIIACVLQGLGLSATGGRSVRGREVSRRVMCGGWVHSVFAHMCSVRWMRGRNGISIRCAPQMGQA